MVSTEDFLDMDKNFHGHKKISDVKKSIDEELGVMVSIISSKQFYFKN